MDDTRSCLNIDELSAKSGLSLSTLRRRLREGKLPYLQPGGPRTRVLFPADILDRLVNQTPAILASQPDAVTLPKPASTARGPQPRWQKKP